MAKLSITSIAIIFTILMVSNVSCGCFWCSESNQCRTKYCRNGLCIKFGDDPNDVGMNPCFTVRCAAGTVCVLQQVQCYQFPCPPIARCAPCTPMSCG